jgi:hypothetical protein
VSVQPALPSQFVYAVWSRSRRHVDPAFSQTQQCRHAAIICRRRAGAAVRKAVSSSRYW